MNHFDLVIVGGGLVGAGMAVALRDAGLRIAVIDARKPSNDDPRLFALNISSCEFLKHVGMWPALLDHASPIHQVHVSNQGHFGAVRLQREDVNVPALGYVVPAKHIEAALNEAVLAQANVTLYQPAKLTKLTHQDGIRVLEVDTAAGTQVLTCALVIGADGTQSTVREQIKVETTIHDYHQSAIVTRTTLSRPHHQVAYERFYAHGAIAMLPLPHDECATIVSADNDKVTELMGLTDEGFLHALQRDFGYRLGRLKQVSARHVFPLRMVRARQEVAPAVYLLGNSAHTLHPIAAQGFNLALYEVAVLVEEIEVLVARGAGLTDLDLPSINARIKKQQGATIAVSHRLPQLFSNKDSSLLSTILPLGMIGFNLAAPIKRRFIDRILGRTGDVPRLLLSAIES